MTLQRLLIPVVFVVLLFLAYAAAAQDESATSPLGEYAPAFETVESVNWAAQPVALNLDTAPAPLCPYQ